ncbi:MAG: universal stress protein [Candidatus Dormibacteraceae bacterium]
MSSTIVVGVDGSRHSTAALRWALSHAERLGETTVVAVFAWELPLIGIPGAFDMSEMEERAKQFLGEVVQQVAPGPGVQLTPVVAHGEPTAALVEAAREADLLVVGTRGRNAFRGLLLGSVSQGCAAAANCPVVIVKV